MWIWMHRLRYLLRGLQVDQRDGGFVAERSSSRFFHLIFYCFSTRTSKKKNGDYVLLMDQVYWAPWVLSRFSENTENTFHLLSRHFVVVYLSRGSLSLPQERWYYLLLRYTKMGLPPNLTDINIDISVCWFGIFFPRSKSPAVFPRDSQRWMRCCKSCRRFESLPSAKGTSGLMNTTARRMWWLRWEVSVFFFLHFFLHFLGVGEMWLDVGWEYGISTPTFVRWKDDLFLWTHFLRKVTILQR